MAALQAFIGGAEDENPNEDENPEYDEDPNEDDVSKCVKCQMWACTQTPSVTIHPEPFLDLFKTVEDMRKGQLL